MKSTLAKISLLTLVGAASISSAFAEAPKCPLYVDYEPSVLGTLPAGGWATQTFFDDPNWEAMQVTMYDSDIKTDADAVKRAGEIQTSVFSAPAELKIYFNDDRTGEYFYTCSYPIEHKYVGLGDSVTFFSVTYTDTAAQGTSVKAVKASKQSTLTQKLNRVVR